MSNDYWIWRSDYVIPSKAGAGCYAVNEVLRELESQEWVEQDIFGIHLAMEEALVNAITHGNGSDSRKQVQIACRLSPQLIRIEVIDEGDGFDLTELPDPTQSDRLEAPGGRGVMLMRAFMSRVTYDPSRGRVVLEKKRGGQT